MFLPIGTHQYIQKFPYDQAYWSVNASKAERRRLRGEQIRPFCSHIWDLKWTGRPGPNSPSLHISLIKDDCVNFWNNLDSRLKIVLLKFGIYIFDSLETVRFYLFIKKKYNIYIFSADFLIVTFIWRVNLKFWWFHRKDLSQIYRDQVIIY